MTEIMSPQSGGVEEFLRLAEKNDWGRFDERVLTICNDQIWIGWTDRGLRDPRIDVRDLAISILENTDSELKTEQQETLNKIMEEDENLHLRRKAAIAQFRHDIKTPDVLAKLKDAQENDPELKEIVTNLLSNGQ